MRFLMPLPMPQRWRRKMMSMGSGHPTRIICSALIAQAFDSVRYPILPKISRVESESAREEILEIRHSSLYAPRDFDISPYFEVVKPTLVVVASSRIIADPLPSIVISPVMDGKPLPKIGVIVLQRKSIDVFEFNDIGLFTTIRR